MQNPVISLLQSFVERKMAAGVSCLVTVDGQETTFDCCGYADMDRQTPFRRDTLLHIYSMSKLVTSAAIMTLVDSGSLALTDPVARFIPEFADSQVCEDNNGTVLLVPARRQLTIFDLLTMTSGIPYPDAGGTRVYDAVAACYAKLNGSAAARDRAGDPMDTLAYIRELAKCPLCFHPGERWMYGLSSDVLGAVVVAATGKSLGTYFDETLFRPLGMQDTGFRMPAEKAGRIATIYTDGPNGIMPRPRHQGFEMVDHPSVEAGGAGLISTVDDYTRFAQMLMNGGVREGIRILSEESVRQMTMNQLTAEQAETYSLLHNAGYGYGLTLRVMMDPSKSAYREEVGAFGWNGATGTTVRIDPARRMTVVFGIQLMPPNHVDFLPALSQAVQSLL